MNDSPKRIDDWAEVLSPPQREVWPVIAAVSQKCEMELLGGTALTLYLRHRPSEDLDLFSIEDFYHPHAVRIMKNCGLEYLPHMVRHNSILVELNTVQVSMARDRPKDSGAYRVKQLHEPTIIDGMRVGSLQDIMASKLNAAATRRAARDMVDLVSVEELTSFTIEDCLSLHSERYGFDISQQLYENLALALEDDSWRTPDTLIPKNTLDEALEYLRKRLPSLAKSMISRRLGAAFPARGAVPTPVAAESYSVLLQSASSEPNSATLDVCNEWMPRAKTRCALTKGHNGPHRRHRPGKNQQDR